MNYHLSYYNLMMS